MASDPLRARIASQFADAGEGAAAWRAIDQVVETDRFLNLGYSPRFLPHAVGSSQRRLAAKVGRTLAAHLGETDGRRLLDVGCGRGGPTAHLAAAHGFDALGLDLVPANLRRAVADAATAAEPVSYAVADTAHLPVRDDSVPAVVAIDSGVYVPDTAAAFAELRRVLAPDGVAVVTDLVAADDGGPSEATANDGDADRVAADDTGADDGTPDRAGADDGRADPVTADDGTPDPVAADDGRADRAAAVAAFAEAWDMPPLASVSAIRRAVEAAGLEVVAFEDLTPHSIGRFRRWSGLYLRLVGGPLGALLRGALRRRGLPVERMTEQVGAAHRALPWLRHVMIVARPADA